MRGEVEVGGWRSAPWCFWFRPRSEVAEREFGARGALGFFGMSVIPKIRDISRCKEPAYSKTIFSYPLILTRMGTASTIELARVVCIARSNLPYGAWTQLWKSGRVGFSKRKGEMLAAIGKQLAELDAQNSAHLPGL